MGNAAGLPAGDDTYEVSTGIDALVPTASRLG
jgi:hypothetical protein